MANAQKVNGFSLIGTISGAPVSGNIKVRQMTGSTAIFPGDVVALDDATGLVVPATASTTTALLGVCVGVKVDRSIASTEYPGYASASSGAYIQVAEGWDYLYVVSEGNSGTPIAIANLGSNIKLNAGGGGNTSFGTSSFYIDQTTLTDSAPATAQFQLVDIWNSVDNALGVYCRWVVRINQSLYNAGSTGI